jgi:hypoxanthine-DNA glycosylase
VLEIGDRFGLKIFAATFSTVSLGVMKKRIRSFDPVASKNARVLILGSMPGERSLIAAEYYAHPRNAFWKIMQEVAGVNPTASYKQRISSLKTAGISLWDVLHSCHRKGSLDAAIKNGSVKINNFDAFFRKHPGICVVLFNGATSERYYKRYVLPEIKDKEIKHIRMPSTSPAHAAVSLKQKIKLWRRGITQQTAARDRVKKRGA